MMYSFKLVFLIVLFACLTLSCKKNSLKEIEEITVGEDLPLISSRNIEIIYSDSAKMQMKLIAPLINNYEGEKPYAEFPKGLKVLFYSKTTGKIESQITANYAIRYTTDEIIEAKNDVIVINKKGERLNTEHLIWNQKTDLIESKDFVKITTNEEVIYGDGLKSNTDFTEYKIIKVKGIIKVEDEQF